MTVTEFTMALTLLSVINGFMTEAVKTVLDAKGVVYATNIVVAIVSVICSAAYGIIYPILIPTTVNASYVVCTLILVVLSWCGSMVGYDKIIQTLKQYEGINNGN